MNFSTAWLIERIDPPFHAVTPAHKLLPIIFSGRGGDEAIDAAETLWVCLEDRSRLEFCILSYLAARDWEMDLGVWARILEMTWLRGKSGSLLTGQHIRYRDLLDMFRLAHPASLMEPSELTTFENLPHTFTAYRGTAGVSVGKARHGMSWTLDASYAAWFANCNCREEDQPLCISATVRKSDVLAYFEQEFEVVIPSGRNRNIEVVPIRRRIVGFQDRAQLLQSNAGEGV